jgi:hypothetical protein
LEIVVRKSIGYACAVVAGLAVVGSACSPYVESGAVGLGRMAPPPSTSADVVDEDLGSLGSADLDSGVRTLDLVWDSADSVDRTLICNLADDIGPVAAGALIAERSDGSFSEFDVTALLIDKCL